MTESERLPEYVVAARDRAQQRNTEVRAARQRLVQRTGRLDVAVERATERRQSGVVPGAAPTWMDWIARGG
jgi:hypothetical protein